MNRWIKYIKAAARVWKNKELRRIILNNPDTLIQSLDKHFSEDDKQVIQKLPQQTLNLVDETQRLADRIKELERKNQDHKQKLQKYKIKKPPELTTKNTHLNYDGRRLIPTRDKVQIKNELKQDDYFHPTKKLKEVAEKYGVETSDSDFEKFRKCLKAVQEEYDYIHDDEQYGVTEHFTLSFEVDATGKDDCESLALTVIDMYLECGGDPEKIYWCLGHVVRGNSSYGHGWVGFRKENGDWFIGEATHSSYNAPDFWKESYQADWGLSNLGGMYRFKEQKKPWENTDIKQSSNFKEYDNKEKDKVLTEIWR